MSAHVRISSPIVVCSRSMSKHAILRERVLERFSNVRFNDEGLTLKGEELVRFVKGSVGAIVALERVDDSVLSALPELKVISKFGVGLDNLDLEAMKRRGVSLGWTGGVNARSVAELFLCFTLGILRKVFTYHPKMATGVWKHEGGAQLTGKTVGVIGCGFIGKEVVQVLKPFRCEVLVNDIVDVTQFCKTENARAASLEEVLSKSDVVTLHVPYDSSTHHLMGSAQLNRMKPSAVLINTSRGNVVDEAALHKALSGGVIAGAAADVFATEPPTGSPLLSLPNFFSTPHIGGTSDEGTIAMGEAAVSNLFQHLSQLVRK